jgi:hypothetical protein
MHVNQPWLIESAMTSLAHTLCMVPNGLKDIRTVASTGMLDAYCAMKAQLNHVEEMSSCARSNIIFMKYNIDRHWYWSSVVILFGRLCCRRGKLGLEFIHRYIFFKDTSGRCIGFIEEEAKTVDTTPIKATRYKHNATQITTQPTTTERQ